jgi:hypothetical protein
MTILTLIALMTFGVMVYAALVAVLVEMFPARIRYTSMSLPYHVGNGWFGGFVPASVFAILLPKAICTLASGTHHHRRRIIPGRRAFSRRDERRRHQPK